MSNNELTDLFIALTGQDRVTAKKYLEENYWSLSTAITFFRLIEMKEKFNDWTTLRHPRSDSFMYSPWNVNQA
ncbi:TPA: hypothetical protein QCH81_002232 [Enterobacter bugandensis]|nr:hypothetical protein [Enterobacter bugandensis]